MKKKSADKNKSNKKKFVKPIIVTKEVSDSILSVYGTYGAPTPSSFGT